MIYYHFNNCQCVWYTGLGSSYKEEQLNRRYGIFAISLLCKICYFNFAWTGHLAAVYRNEYMYTNVFICVNTNSGYCDFSVILLWWMLEYRPLVFILISSFKVCNWILFYGYHSHVASVDLVYTDGFYRLTCTSRCLSTVIVALNSVRSLLETMVTTKLFRSPVNILQRNLEFKSRVSCQKGPTRHACAWQIGPFWQDTLDWRGEAGTKWLQFKK